jgi:ABC-type cobalamin transport system ATPase subunit
MSADYVNDARHWRDCAAQMRALAQSAKTIDEQAKMLKLAAEYDRIARRVSGGGWQPQSS